MHLRVAVCPHDSAKNKSVWLYFITYLSRKIGADLTMEQCFDFPCYYESFPRIDLSYSSPLDALKLRRERGFIPVAGNDNYDEVVIVANKSAERSLEAIEGEEVLGVKGQFATYLGAKVLGDKGVSFSINFRDSWQDVLTDVSKGVARYGFIYKDFWQQLSDISKSGVVTVFESDTRFSSHIVMLAEEMLQYREHIRQALEDMPSDEEGAKILAELRISKWYPVDNLDHLEKLLKEVKVWL